MQVGVPFSEKQVVEDHAKRIVDAVGLANNILSGDSMRSIAGYAAEETGSVEMLNAAKADAKAKDETMMELAEYADKATAALNSAKACDHVNAKRRIPMLTELQQEAAKHAQKAMMEVHVGLETTY